MERENRYVAGGNIFWVSMVRSMSPNMPMSLKRVRDLQENFYSSPAPFKGMIHVHLEGADDAVGDIPVKGGNLLCLSPEELPHAFLLAVADAVTSGQSEEVLEQWKKYAKSVCLHFEKGGSPQDLYWTAFNLRESLVSTNNTVQRTAMQRAVEVFELRAALTKEGGTHTLDMLAMAYSVRGRLATASESMDTSFIQMCLNVYEKALRVPQIVEVLQALEESYGLQSCLNSISKIARVLEKCDGDMRVVVFQALHDGIQTRQINNGNVTRDFLIGSSKKDNRIPFVQLVHFKWKCRSYLLNTSMPREMFDTEDIREIGEATKDYPTFRQKVQAVVDGEEANTQWMGRLRQSATLALRIIQEQTRASHCQCVEIGLWQLCLWNCLTGPGLWHRADGSPEAGAHGERLPRGHYEQRALLGQMERCCQSSF